MQFIVSKTLTMKSFLNEFLAKLFHTLVYHCQERSEIEKIIKIFFLCIEISRNDKKMFNYWSFITSKNEHIDKRSFQTSICISRLIQEKLSYWKFTDWFPSNWILYFKNSIVNCLKKMFFILIFQKIRTSIRWRKLNAPGIWECSPIHYSAMVPEKTELKF